MLKFGKSINALEGALWDKIILFALPLALSSLLQQFFNSADIAVIGRFCGSEALAAMGVTSPAVGIFINCFVGLSVGVTVIISQYIGAGRLARVKKAVHTSLTLSVVAGIILMLAGWLITDPLLALMYTPASLQAAAGLYLRIYFAGVPFLTVYNFASAVFRANGDTKKPLIALALGGVLNVLLNLFFVIVLGMSIEGVALATSISSLISAGIMIFFLLREQSLIRMEWRLLCFSLPLVKKILRVGIPTSVQGMVFSLSNMVIQFAINSLGAAAMAASAVALNFELWAFYCLSSFAQAATAFVGLNYGARKFDRCLAVTRWCLWEGIAASVLVSAFFVIFIDPLTALFTNDAQVAELTRLRVYWIVSFEFVSTAMDIFSGSLRGYGSSLLPAVITIVGVCVLRVIYVYTIFAAYQSFGVLMAVYPLSWTVTMLGIAIAYFYVKRTLLPKTL